MKIQGKIQEKGKVTFIQAIKDFYKGYIDFGGRSTRAGYWWATLFTFIITFLYGIGFIAATVNFVLNDSANQMLGLVIILGGAILAWIFLFPGFPLTCRRMRDAGMTTTAIVVFYILSIAVAMVSSIHEDSTFFAFATSIVGLIKFVITLLPSDQLTTDSQNPWAQKFFRQKEVKPLTGKEAKPSTVIQRAMENEDGTKVVPALAEEKEETTTTTEVASIQDEASSTTEEKEEGIVSKNSTPTQEIEEKTEETCSSCSHLTKENTDEKKD